MTAHLGVALAAAALVGVTGAASAQDNRPQDNRPATHRGNGTAMYDHYRFFTEDRARMVNGAHEKAMEDGRQSMGSFANLRARDSRGRQEKGMEEGRRSIESFATLRAREGRPVTPRR